MSKTDTFENDVLKLLLLGTAIPNIADNAAASPLTQFWLSLHASDPGEAANQTTNEIVYPGYARVAVARSASGFNVVGGTATLVAIASFPQASGGTTTVTHCGIGTAATGTGKLLYKGPVSPNLGVAAGVTPQLGTGTTLTEE
jgi:hypothetical protein